jgi:putative photosynthetic complex assembly protein 2
VTVTEFAIPALYALLVWWLGTGIVLTVVRRRTDTYRASLVVGLTLAVAALVVIAASSHKDTELAAYLGFTAAIVVWGFVELTFLTGLITGPNKANIAASISGIARLRPAVASVIHHELALLAGGVAILIAAQGAIGATAVLTYSLLWIMRLSAKINLFLGVPQLHDELLPTPILHLRSHFRRRPVSSRLAISILMTLAAGLALVWLAITATPSASATEHALLASLCLLACLEHVFMLIPVPLMKMWNWGGRRAQPVNTEISITRRGI